MTGAVSGVVRATGYGRRSPGPSLVAAGWVRQHLVIALRGAGQIRERNPPLDTMTLNATPLELTTPLTLGGVSRLTALRN